MTRLIAGARNDPTQNAPTSALYFGAANSSVVTASDNAVLHNLAGVTIEAWVNVGTTPAVLARVMDVFASNAGFNLEVNTSGINATVQANVGNGTITGNLQVGLVRLEHWTHIAMSWDLSTIRIFINGTVQGTTTTFIATDTGNYNTSTIYIGNASGTNRPFPGLIQELRISSGARYISTFTPQTTPFVADASTVLLMHMDEGTGTTVADSSGNGITGTLGGTPLPRWSLGLLTKTNPLIARSTTSGRTTAGVRSSA